MSFLANARFPGIQNTKTDRLLCFLAPFLLATSLAFVLCFHITLPFSNPWQITGPLTLEHYNPADNIARFLLIVLSPVALLVALSVVLKAHGIYSWLPAAPHEMAGKPAFSSSWVLLLFGSLLYCTILLISSFSPMQSIDPFHDGESLGASETVRAGGVPYKDVIFVHGVFQDPLRPITAFALFHRSIGATRTLDSMIFVLCFLVLFAFLLELFDGRFIYAHFSFAILFLAVYTDNLLIEGRDIPTFSFLLVFVILAHAINKPKFRFTVRTLVAFLFFAFLPVAAMAYSVDRGFYICATFCVLAPLILSGLRRQDRYIALLILLLGVALGFSVLAIALHWEFRAFYDFTFRVMPRYKELMDGYIFPFGAPKYLLVVLLIAWNTYWVAAEMMAAMHRRSTESPLRGGILSLFRHHIVELGLSFISLCFFRSGLGRSDWAHVCYSYPLALILLMYLIFRYWLHGALERSKALKAFFRYSLVCSVLTMSLLGTDRILRTNQLTDNFPLNRADADYLPLSYRAGSAFLIANLSGNESFFTMTSEGIWYYLIGRPSPCRFPVVWFAMPPFYQEGIVRDLSTHNVKFVLYKNSSASGSIDGITSSERLPIVDRYIRDNYRYYTTVDNNEFWIRKFAFSPTIQN